eukprot:scaffold124831_cov19-Tisochrysis_lutea.AAC.1
MALAEVGFKTPQAPSSPHPLDGCLHASGMPPRGMPQQGVLVAYAKVDFYVETRQLAEIK